MANGQCLRLVGTQMGLTLYAEEMGHTSPHDNRREGNVQQTGKEVFLYSKGAYPIHIR